MNNKIKSNSSQCQVLWFSWRINDEDIDDSSTDFDTISRADGYDMSDHIDLVSYTKTLNSPAGQFTIRLDNSRDWKDVIKPGEWCIISMSQDGDLEFNDDIVRSGRFSGLRKAPTSLSDKSKIRCVGYIERVATDVQLDEDGAFNVFYEVSGRDFGVIYEETELWFNYLFYEKLTLENLNSFIEGFSQKTTSELIEFAHNFFFAPRRINGLGTTSSDQDRSLLSIGQQWLLPRPLLRILGQSSESATFFGEINDLLNLEDTGLQIPVVNPINDIEGNAWSKLKEYSIPEFHELFPELTNDGKMRLNYRPIPWAFDRRGYPSVSSIKSFKDLAEEDGIPVESADLYSYNLGEDNHSRYNHFYLYIQSTLYSATSNISMYLNQTSKKGNVFPFKIGPSINRHGFRPMHTEINSLSLAVAKNDKNKDGDTVKPLLLEYAEILVDYWRKSVFFETGSVEMIGKNEVRIGKVLDFGEDILFDPNKYFYIEGYTDEFSIGPEGQGQWTQTINVTRGIEKGDLDSSQGYTILKGTSRREKQQTSRADFTRDKSRK